MNPGSILEKCAGLSVAKTRKMDEKYSEIVLFNKDLGEWDKALARELGPAEKPRNRRPSKQQQALAKKFGGVRHGQTLYVKAFENQTVVAMFWPWRDRTHTTLKMGVLSSVNNMEKNT